MGEDTPRRTDAELFGMVDEPGDWVVWAGRKTVGPQPSLRAALGKAYDLSAAGYFLIRIVMLPDDSVVIDATRMARL
jgi:hypothetical protein